MIERLAVLGVGLIGGSVAAALKRSGAVRRVVGYGRGRANLEEALALGVIDEIADSPEAAVAGADRVLLAMPVGAMAATFVRIAAHLAPHALPLAENAPADVAAVADFWRACGAQASEMSAAGHDRVFAAVSHLPHLAAFALVDELAARPEAGLYFRHAGSGFRDFTRIAGSSPEMWRDIALANRDALTAELDAYLSRLSAYRDALIAGDADTLMQSFTRASQARSRWQPNGNHIENDE